MQHKLWFIVKCEFCPMKIAMNTSIWRTKILYNKQKKIHCTYNNTELSINENNKRYLNKWNWFAFHFSFLFLFLIHQNLPHTLIYILYSIDIRKNSCNYNGIIQLKSSLLFLHSLHLLHFSLRSIPGNVSMYCEISSLWDVAE